MSWNDDRWKDSYDAWKLASPDDYYDDDPDEELCDHDDYDADFNGRATCYRCGHSWYLTAEQIAAEHERQAAYDEHCQKQARRERWRALTAPFRWAWYRVLDRVASRLAIKSLHDDEIPF